MEFKSMDVALLVTTGEDVLEVMRILDEIEMLEDVLSILGELGDVLRTENVVDFADVDEFEKEVVLDVLL